jgi:hypothetical protein
MMLSLRAPLRDNADMGSEEAVEPTQDDYPPLFDFAALDEYYDACAPTERETRRPTIPRGGRAARCTPPRRQPPQLYHDGNSQVRRNLNDTFFQKLYIDDCEVVEDELKPLFAELSEAKRAVLAVQQSESRNASEPERPRNDKTGLHGLAGIFSANGSSKTVLVELRGFEPLTPTLPV